MFIAFESLNIPSIHVSPKQKRLCIYIRVTHKRARYGKLPPQLPRNAAEAFQKVRNAAGAFRTPPNSSERRQKILKSFCFRDAARIFQKIMARKKRLEIIPTAKNHFISQTASPPAVSFCRTARLPSLRESSEPPSLLLPFSSRTSHQSQCSRR